VKKEHNSWGKGGAGGLVEDGSQLKKSEEVAKGKGPVVFIMEKAASGKGRDERKRDRMLTFRA